MISQTKTESFNFVAISVVEISALSLSIVLHGFFLIVNKQLIYDGKCACRKTFEVTFQATTLLQIGVKCFRSSNSVAKSKNDIYKRCSMSVPLLEQYDRVRERNRDNNKITGTKEGAI